MARTTVARHIIDTLHASGVRRVYGLPGDSLNGVTDAIRQVDGVDWMTTRHEEAAAFAASAEAALTGELAVCAGSCGPGNLHLINGLFDAQRSGVPVLALASHIPSGEIGTGYFQETHPQEVFRECSVYAELVSSAEQAPRLLRIAMRAAIERRGVAVLVLPGDVALEEIAAEVTAIRPTSSQVVPAEEDLARAAGVLDDCEDVTILAGAGRDTDDLLIISDDAQWCRQELAPLLPTAPRYLQDRRSMFDDLAALVSSRSLVLANSTFSYWGSYLARALHEDHLAIAPPYHQRVAGGGAMDDVFDPRWPRTEETRSPA